MNHGEEPNIADPSCLQTFKWPFNQDVRNQNHRWGRHRCTVNVSHLSVSADEASDQTDSATQVRDHTETNEMNGLVSVTPYQCARCRERHMRSRRDAAEQC